MVLPWDRRSAFLLFYSLATNKENLSLGEKESKENKVIHIKDWPEGDRPSEMLLEKSPEALSDAALLAILLSTGRQGKDAVALAREMLTLSV